ncbi:MAG TPA: hypothetical protein VMH04_14050 [Candidatus Solibacter sp.]|nr:hypothetical protein [Candidatus Solibacter sp.]
MTVFAATGDGAREVGTGYSAVRRYARRKLQNDFVRRVRGNVCAMARLAQLVSSHELSLLFFGALVALVIVTSILGRPKRLAGLVEFPAPLGAKLIAWALMALWMLLLVAALGVGMYWLAAVFAIGPAYTIWRWPATISIDEWQVSRFAWCHPRVTIRWNEVESISASRDTFELKGRSGAVIRISIYQVGADELMREIVRQTGIAVPSLR